ncbi:MAG TPA: hypothetical protein VJX66_08990 [Amycolatopsis sp.]|nr:hypothetical protein [Amycolatopsis sp.]
MLYARSRQVPVAFAALVLGAAGIWLLAREWWSVLFVALTLTVGVSVGAIGWSGQDPDLDRTAAIRWPVRRFGHIVLVGLLAGAAVLVVQALGVRDVDISTLMRDGAGLLGLAGIAATFAGGRFGWTLPFVWFVVGVFAPGGDDLKTQILRWMFEPPDTAAATWTAVVLGVAGIGAYAGWGGRR